MKEHVEKLVNANVRLDGRKTDEYRDVKVEYGVAELAEGSARVTVGETVVIAGVKMSTMAPYPDQPDKGTIMVGAEQLPLSNPSFESGPPNESAIEWARITDRAIRESGALDFKKMCIKAGEKIWVAAIDIYPINDSGNLFDAGALAAIAALKHTKLPKLNGDVVDYKAKTEEKLPLSDTPISCTIWKIGKKLVVDPLTEEEAAMGARLTVATRGDGKLCALQKGGSEDLDAEEIKEMISLGVKKTAVLRKLL